MHPWAVVLQAKSALKSGTGLHLYNFHPCLSPLITADRPTGPPTDACSGTETGSTSGHTRNAEESHRNGCLYPQFGQFLPSVF